MNLDHRMKLTKRIVEALDPRMERYTVWDVELAGFGVRVSPKGGKSYGFKYTLNGHQRWLTIGTHGALTTEEARRKATIAKGLVQQGEDPCGEKAERKKALPTMADLMDRFEAQHLPRLKPTTQTTYRIYLSQVMRPKLGRLLARELGQDEIAKLHHDLRATPRKANQVFAILSKMLNLAEVWGLRVPGSNPCTLLRRAGTLYPERVIHNPMDEDQAVKLARTLERMEEEGDIYPPAVHAIRLILFTGCRRSEILTAKWEWVKKGRDGAWDLCLPDSKTGAKVVHLNGFAAVALEALRTLSVEDNPYLVPGIVEGKPFQGMGKTWGEVREAAGLPHLRIHDLRHTFGAALGDMEANSFMIQTLLHHAQPSTTGRYAKPLAVPLRGASEKGMKKLAGAMGIKSPQAPSKPARTKKRAS